MQHLLTFCRVKGNRVKAERSGKHASDKVVRVRSRTQQWTDKQQSELKRDTNISVKETYKQQMVIWEQYSGSPITMETDQKHLEHFASGKKKRKSNGEDVGKKGTLIHCWFKYKLIQSLLKIEWKFFKTSQVILPSNLTTWSISKRNIKTSELPCWLQPCSQ